EFADNAAGGISVDPLNTLSPITTIINSTISGNSGKKGGGINGAGTVTIRNSTIAGNSAGSGGGIYQTSGSLPIRTSTVAGTSGDIASALTGTPATSYNLIGAAASAGGLTNGVNGNIVGITPRLGPLANNGGPTRTHALLAGSPAIDAG